MKPFLIRIYLMPLFQNSVVKKYLAGQDPASMHAAFGAYLTYFHDPMRRANIRASKEEQYQEGFLRALFVNILGYTINPDPDYNLTTELKNIKDSKKTDGAILKDGKAIAVIELKGTDTKDLEKIRDQAFNYKNNHPECIYVITSNFEKLRFYIHNAVDYVEFSILQMQQEEFRLLWLLLQKDNLLAGIPQQIKTESLLVEEQVTKKLYADYSAFKQELWQDIVANNPGLDELLLYKKSQRLLDRFLFIFFAEDKGLLPPNSISEIVKQWDKLTEMDEYRPLYDRFKKYFGYMNTGRVLPGKAEIHAYNGGLFAPDELLDSLTISDALLKKHVSKLTEYDFESEVDTNILGHIFEHSLNDIENVRASLEGTQVDKSKTKRKKDGVFYTPKYITKYIVDNTVGKLCTEKKAELGIVDEEFAKGKAGRKKDTLQKLVAQLKAYREWLLQLAICDPACGSGAFLNQVLEFLMAEHRYLDELESMLFESSIVFPNVENHILENNIFGVDINEESVEIARLSLWLRTAQKGRKLSTLSSNIKVGNSLIDDPEVAGDLAFDWQAQFPKVFAKGGFDVVVGNPPYVDLKGLDNDIVNYIFKKFITSNNRVNLYSTFIEKSIDLIDQSGRLSFIIPSSILTQSSYKDLRALLLKETSIENIVRLPNESFGGSAGEVKVDTIIITFLNKRIQGKKTEVIVYKGFDRISEISKLNADIHFELNQNQWSEDSESIIKINTNSKSEEIVKKIEKGSIHLIDCADFCLGLTPYDKYKGHTPETINNRIFHSTFQKDGTFKKLLAGNDIRRYIVEWGGEEWISYGDWLGAPRESRFFTNKRILVKQIIDWSDKRIWAALTEEEFYNTQNAFNLLPKPEFTGEYLIALINSNLMSFYHKKKFLEEFKDRFQKILIKDAKLFPIKVLDLESQNIYTDMVNAIVSISKELKELNSKLVSLLVNKYELNKPSTKLQNWPELDFKGFLGELAKAKVKLSLSEEAEWMAYFHEQKAKAQSLQSDINRLDREIDALVYELYGLTEEEIRVVEGNV
ncbi:BREX-1 system adenine-specific DNA-methyltransferase PglX [Aquiflexum gelatinilyticum]|uniref:BREX-1 system adenine-specific DNA-methyltransferase PglX n=1 Tax=Aquiflexum gelatinilyticum TaxID=2961943 RepID=UPI0021686DE5|nr:BREX-1 system adenine-specific DNA-methyltransferase PglX [Aquiflexum gelatinilyticum]MCS4434198.1 BREX-1 system adenine-specific DNA-methyltransferase PglX [Aquiflexum gelatinilyticum]